MTMLPLHMSRSPLAPAGATATAVVALLLSTLGSKASSSSTSSTTTGAAFVSTTTAARGGGAGRVFLPPDSAPAGRTTDRGRSSSSSAIVGHDHPRRRRGFWGYAAGEEEATLASAGIGTTLRASSSSSALNYVNDDDNSEVIQRGQHLKQAGDTHGVRERYGVAPNGGRVTLVGAGPGSPDLLTVAAHRILTGEEGEVGGDNGTPKKLIIADRLVSDEILDLCRNAEIRVARKYPGCAEKAQEEIYRWAEEGLREGRHVIRLKIGDPFVFGRGGEEVLKFREEMGMEPRVVPGVSAAFSAPLLGGIPVTHRGVSNQVVMCTGYGRNGTSPDLIQYHEEQTVVFLMAVGRLRQLCDNLAEMAGYPRDTPVGIVERAGCPDQRTLVGTMDMIGDLAEEHGIRAPSTIVVGKVVGVLMEDLRCDEEGDAATTPVQGLVQALNVTSLV